MPGAGNEPAASVGPAPLPELHDAEDRYRALVEQLPLASYVKRLDEESAAYISPQIFGLVGYTAAEWTADRGFFGRVLHPDDCEGVLAAFADMHATGDPVECEYRLVARDGRIVWIHDAAVVVRDEYGRPQYAQGYMIDVTERKRNEAALREQMERIEYQALHDTLTGLPNRALVLDRAEQMLARARRLHCPVAALYLDIDDLKHVNDMFGHAAGDTLLKAVGARLSGIVRGGDTVGRLSGDEFVALLDSAELDASPELVAERILDVLRQPVELNRPGERPLSITASIGIATGQRASAEELLRDADIALYQAKEAGRDRYKLFETSMHTTVQDRGTLEMDLHDALENEQFFLLYQPTFDLRRETMTGVEALIRWAHPSRGVLEPDQFIPMAEQNGSIVTIGRWVLEEACAQAAAWHRQGRRVGMAVNISTRQLDRDEFVDEVRSALTRNGLEPSTLTLEITETTLMRDPQAAAKRLNALKTLGLRIAIDDFGTGYSSLAYLQQFPIDTLKIDRSFISAISASPESRALIHTLVQLGKTLGLETLGEGIEDQAQLQTLQREHCDLGQGYLFARPLSVEAIEQFFERDSPTDPTTPSVLEPSPSTPSARRSPASPNLTETRENAPPGAASQEKPRASPRASNG